MPALFSPNGVTLLICTHNGESRLHTTLHHIAAQQVPMHISWEVILVSNASLDKTIEVATDLCEELQLPVPYRVLDESVAGKENALIRGFEAAKYEFIAIVDDDNWLAADYVAVAYETMLAHPEIGILGAHAQGAYEITPPEWFDQFKAVYAIGPQNEGVNGPLPDNVGYIYGAGSVVRQSGWRKLYAHGFSFTTSAKRGKVLSGGEDLELGDALRLAGYKLWYNDQLRFQHFMFKERMTWQYLMRMARSTASSQITSVVYYFIFRHPSLTVSRFRFLYTKRLLWLSIQIVRQPRALINALLYTDQESLTHNFEMLRLIYNIKSSLRNWRKSTFVFKSVNNLKKSLVNKRYI
ncbi:glycosyltransferase [Hymenobacter profundi]|uniref:glycosyltransferase n=1 Tax=Hymenobacter profundi TaxID=1982110 RepID=UPI001C576DDC|nr:glycosyltransferase [Hymenobacter profundi]